MPEIPKAYEPTAVEEKWYARWLADGCFTANPDSPKPAYSIVIPPPNVTGVLTLGHVLNNTIQDILARRARMLGKEVLWLPGTDHAGIATQTVVERKLRKDEGKTRRDVGREEFLKRVWAWKEKHGGIIIQQLKKLGCSCDWTRERFTMDAGYSREVQKVFVELYNKGLIYRGKRMVNWDPAAQTALSDEEVIMKPANGTLFYIRYEVVEEPGTFLEIATTRPETLMGDSAVAVHPADERYARFVGKHCWRPFPRAEIPIIADEHIDPKFGTGVLKVTPAHDKADFEIGQRHRLEVLDVMNPDGTLNALAGSGFSGMERFAARKVAAEKLRELGLLIKEEPHQNNVGYSERTDVPIEPRLSEQWFLKYPQVEKARGCVGRSDLLQRRVRIVTSSGDEIQAATIDELRDAALRFARKQNFLGQTFINEDSGIALRVRRKSLSHAFSNRGEANIKAVAVLPELIRTAIHLSSEPHHPQHPRFRRVHRFVAALSLGGHLYRIQITGKELADGNVLYDHKAKKIAPGGKSLVAHPLAEKLGIQPAPGATIQLRELFPDVNAVGALCFYPERWEKVYDHWMENIQDWCISRQLWWGHRVPVWSQKNDPAQKHVSVEAPADAENWEQDPDVLDTWFSSWLWPFATMDEKTRTKFYPTDDLVTGPDIIFFWVARMIMAGFEFTGEKPFSNVFFTGLIRDGQGRKMSKSLGNSPDPLELIAKYGADGLRFGLMRIAPQGQDIRFDEKQVEEGRNFANKLWNAARFRQMHGPSAPDVSLTGLPLSIYSIDLLAKLEALLRNIESAYADYRFNEVAAALYDFLWSEYCDWYVEAAKTEVFSEDAAAKNSALSVMDYVLNRALRLLHPFMPHLTEELWERFGFSAPNHAGGALIMFADFPKASAVETLPAQAVLDAQTRVAAVYQSVRAARNLRAESRVPSNKKVRFVLKSPPAWAVSELPTFARLINASEVALDPVYEPAQGVPRILTPLGELCLPVEGAVDLGAERERLQKEIVKVEAELATARRKLSSENFVTNAPAAVVAEHRQRAAKWQEKLAQLQQMLAALEG